MNDFEKWFREYAPKAPEYLDDCARDAWNAATERAAKIEEVRKQQEPVAEIPDEWDKGYLDGITDSAMTVAQHNITLSQEQIDMVVKAIESMGSRIAAYEREKP